MSPRRYRITIDGQEHEVEVGDLNATPVTVTVDGVTYDVDVPNRPARAGNPPPRPTPPPAHPRPPAPTGGPAPASAGVMTAIMPGRVLSVAVSPGDTVARGDPVCVIEAMKMEQQITAPRAGTVRAVHISVGDTVSHGQPLVEFA